MYDDDKPAQLLKPGAGQQPDRVRAVLLPQHQGRAGRPQCIG